MRFVCLDLETTGLKVYNGDKIIEIGMIEIMDGKITGYQYQQYVNPEKEISKDVTKITNITQEILNPAPIFKNIIDKVKNFIEIDSNGLNNKGILVAHNMKFDLSFLVFQFEESGYKNYFQQFQKIDSIDIIRRKFPGSKLTLDSICEKYNINLEERKQKGHGALLDSKILAEVFLKLIEDFNIDEILFKKDQILEIKKQKIPLKSRNFQLSSDDLELHVMILKKIKVETW